MKLLAVVPSIEPKIERSGPTPKLLEDADALLRAIVKGEIA